MKKIIQLILVMLSGFVLFGCHKNKIGSHVKDIHIIKDAYLYEYQYKDKELPLQYRNDSQYHYYLFVVSIDLEKDINLSDLSVEDIGLDYYGERINELEENKELTQTLYFDKVELNDEMKYDYFVYKVDKKISEFEINKIQIQYNNDTIEKSIDMIMKL